MGDTLCRTCVDGLWVFGAHPRAALLAVQSVNSPPVHHEHAVYTNRDIVSLWRYNCECSEKG